MRLSRSGKEDVVLTPEESQDSGLAGSCGVQLTAALPIQPLGRMRTHSAADRSTAPFEPFDVDAILVATRRSLVLDQIIARQHWYAHPFERRLGPFHPC